MRDAENGTAILDTNRTEVFFYITLDGSRNWDLMDITLPEGYSDAGAYGKRAYIESGNIILPIVCGGEALRYVSADEGRSWKWE